MWLIMNSHASQLPNRIVQLLQKGNFTPKEMIASRTRLQSIGLSDDDIRAVKIWASRELINSQTAAQYAAKMNNTQLKFGIRSLNRIIRNGLSRGITEISGESGVGKSQICLHLSLMVQLSVARGGLGKAAVFICTEDAFPSKRLFQMANTFTKCYGDKNYLDNIFIEHVHDSAHLVNCVSNRLPCLMRQKSIGLVVVDSVAGVFRLESNAISRAEEMRNFVHGLQMMSTKYGFAVICVNQVTSQDDENKGSTKLAPSLGLAWSNLVTTRLQIQKTSDSYTTRNITRAGKFIETTVPIRKCSVLFAPDMPRAWSTFMITADGLVDIPVF